MRVGGPSKPARRAQPWWRRILGWIGGGIALALLAGFIVGIVWRMVAPAAGQRPGEGDFAILELVDNPSGFPQGIVAKAVILIEGKHVDIPLRADQREGMEPDDMIHVRYTFLPNLRHYRIESWSPQSTPPPEKERAPEP